MTPSQESKLLERAALRGQVPHIFGLERRRHPRRSRHTPSPSPLILVMTTQSTQSFEAPSYYDTTESSFGSFGGTDDGIVHHRLVYGALGPEDSVMTSDSDSNQDHDSYARVHGPAQPASGTPSFDFVSIALRPRANSSTPSSHRSCPYTRKSYK